MATSDSPSDSPSPIPPVKRTPKCDVCGSTEHTSHDGTEPQGYHDGSGYPDVKTVKVFENNKPPEA